MRPKIFETIFGKDPKDFKDVEEVDAFVEEKIGRKLRVGYIHKDISSCRGSILHIKETDADKILDEALRK